VLIVGSGEVAVDEEMLQISFESPIGMAIREKKVGESARVRLAGSRK
jgi:transcription elongation GreA/GreB family factor